MADHKEGFVGGFPSERDLTSIQRPVLDGGAGQASHGQARLGLDSDGAVWAQVPDRFGVPKNLKLAAADAIKVRDALLALKPIA